MATALTSQSTLSLDLPPAYTGVTRPARPARPVSDLLNYQYPLAKIRHEPWAYLNLKSRGGALNQRPQYFQGEPVVGSVDIDVPKSDVIQSVTIHLYGHLVTNPLIMAHTIVNSPYATKRTFLDLSADLWSPNGQSTALVGKHTWAFNLTMPEKCGLDSKSSGKGQWPLPPSFAERDTPFAVQYELVLNIRRGKLRGDSKLDTVINYTPLIFPDQPSPLRQLVYRENLPSLIGPHGDPEGWHTLEPVIMRGTVFQTREIDVACTLSLAKPLCYTRGTTIPLVLHISAPDPQALHLLASPSAPVVRLVRRATYQPKLHSPDQIDDVALARDDPSTESIVIDTARFWPSPEGEHDASATQRELHGEVRVPSRLKPACMFGHARISYALVLQPWEATAFVPAAKKRDWLASQSVKIATAYASGPRPRPFAPPDYT